MLFAAMLVVGRGLRAAAPGRELRRPAAITMESMRRSRAFMILFAAVLLLHGAVLLWSLAIAFEAIPSTIDVGDTAVVVPLCLVFFWTMLALWPAYTRTIAALSGLLVASALLTPGVVVVVGLILLNAHLVGAGLLAWVRRDDNTSAALPASVTTLIGLCAWIGVMSITASMKFHYAPVYVAALLAPLGVWWRQALSVLNSLRQALVRPAAATRGTERAWITLLLTLLVLHLFIVAKPEVGYDANAMHLQFARLFAEYHRWRFDVARYAWAVMPLGTDYAFGAAYILGGESATRLLNFCFGGLSCLIGYQLICRYARREIALLSVCLFASTPLAFLETGTLFAENLWIAFLLGTLLLTFDYVTTRSAATLAAFAMLCAGAMQTKLIGLIWITPLVLYLGYLVSRRKGAGVRTINHRALLLILAATLLAAWPYANAWMRTGNPVFPFVNDLFRSPYFDSGSSFTNPFYVVPLRPWSIYELFFSSGRFIEGRDGAAGFHWLLLLPVILLAFLRRRPLAQWLCFALAALFFIVVFSQQAYLRYLLPVLLLITVLGGWALSDLPWTRATRIALLTVGGTLWLLNLQFMYAASWTNETLCMSCTLDSQTRTEYVAAYLPDRAIAEYLNDTLPQAGIGFFTLNSPGASGYIGYSRAANWHDVEVYRALGEANSAEDVLAIARRYRLTYAVFLEPSAEGDNSPIPAIGAFRDRYTSPVWQFRGRVVARIKLPSE
jgi:Dolichyl-phosphate-mannose-protein mannosyltransferase